MAIHIDSPSIDSLLVLNQQSGVRW